MTESFIEQAVYDPVLARFDLPLRRTFYPFGFPLELETNSRDVIEAMSEEWGAFERRFAEAPVRLCLGVSDSDSEPAGRSTVRSREHMLTVMANPENFMVYDFERGFGFGWVTQRLASQHPVLRLRFLAGAGRWMVEQRALAPLHGALVGRNGKGILLCGDSFAGKSTLSYACAKAGWTFLSDDATFLVRSRADRYAIGNPHRIRLRVDASALFPELSGLDHMVRPNGDIAIELNTHEFSIETAAGLAIDHVVLLNRDESGPADLRRSCADRIQQSWRNYTPFGADRVIEEQRNAYQRLLKAGLWDLHYTHVDDAVARLGQLLDKGC
jgi:hypothetical protein